MPAKEKSGHYCHILSSENVKFITFLGHRDTIEGTYFVIRLPSGIPKPYCQRP